MLFRSEPVVARYRGKTKRRYFRGDAAYANPGIYEFLCVSAWKKDPSWGVIGVQKGPL